MQDQAAGITSTISRPEGGRGRQRRPYGWLIFSQLASGALFYIVIDMVELSWWGGETDYSRSAAAIATAYPFFFIGGVIASWILVFRWPELARKISSWLLLGAAFMLGFMLLHFITV